MFYAISGGYGFEQTLSREQLHILYSKGYGTEDLDYKIYFDVDIFNTKYGRDINETSFIQFRNNIIQELLKRNIIKEPRRVRVKGMGIAVVSDKVDLFIGDISQCTSLRYFMNVYRLAPGKEVIDMEYTMQFNIFSALHMFMLCHGIIVGKILLCGNDLNRVPKYKKILFRVALLTNDIKYLNEWETFESSDEWLQNFSKLIWFVINNKDFQYYNYVIAIRNMTGLPKVFGDSLQQTTEYNIPGQVNHERTYGGDGEPCLLLDASTTFDLFEPLGADFEKDTSEGNPAGDHGPTTAEDTAEDTAEYHGPDPDEDTAKDIIGYDEKLDKEPPNPLAETSVTQDQGQQGGSSDGTGKIAAILGCIGALIFSTVVGSVRR